MPNNAYIPGSDANAGQEEDVWWWWYKLVSIGSQSKGHVFMVQRSLAAGCPCLPLPRQPLPQLLWQAQADQAVVLRNWTALINIVAIVDSVDRPMSLCFIHSGIGKCSEVPCGQVHLHDLLSLLFVAHLKLQPRVLHVPWEPRLWRCLAWAFVVPWYGSSEREAGHGKRLIGWRKNMQEDARSWIFACSSTAEMEV